MTILLGIFILVVFSNISAQLLAEQSILSWSKHAFKFVSSIVFLTSHILSPSKVPHQPVVTLRSGYFEIESNTWGMVMIVRILWQQITP